MPATGKKCKIIYNASMTIDIITLFPDMFKGPFSESIVARAIDKKLLNLKIHNLRDWAIDKRGTVDDKPYGGGVGMLLRPEPIFDCVKEIQESGIRIQELNHESKIVNRESKVILLDAGGKLYNQQRAVELSKLNRLILICGHYEGVDYRVHEGLADEVISIGDYVLTGGEIPAMVLVDSVTRLLPGVLDLEATSNESFSPDIQSLALNNKKAWLLEYPQYTRPEVYRSHKVPSILLSGNHAKIKKWRTKKAIERTKQNRPDLLR
jgi:tRNA (guanine37-N1)-methyltransferase